jgi:serine phosphatase RsbU (regulator of sigma subunit)
VSDPVLSGAADRLAEIVQGRLNLKTREVLFSGANNPLWIVRNNELTVIKGEKQPIAFSQDALPFNNTALTLHKGDSVYLFSDGFADQFGGDKGKKFMVKNLKELILSISEKPMEKQKALINSAFNSWKGELEQVDDVCVIGIRL